MPPAITITLRFDEKLKKITATDECPIILSEGAAFAFLLMSVMTEWPGIAHAYPPGTLGFTLNGKRPETYSPLFNGDVVHFRIPKTAKHAVSPK